MFIFQCQRHRCSTFIHGGHYVFTQCICSRSLPTGFGRFSMEYLALDATRCRHNIATWWSNLDLVDPQQGCLMISLYLNPHLLVNCWKLIIILRSFISGNMMWGCKLWRIGWIWSLKEKVSGEGESLGWVVRRRRKSLRLKLFTRIKMPLFLPSCDTDQIMISTEYIHIISNMTPSTYSITDVFPCYDEDQRLVNCKRLPSHWLRAGLH